MTKQICEISASSWFYYKEICYYAWSHERTICQVYIFRRKTMWNSGQQSFEHEGQDKQ